MVQSQTASVSMIQRRLRVGYTRAGRLIDMLERRGIISGYEGSKPRQVLVSEGELGRMLERLSGDGDARSPEGVERRPRARHRGRARAPQRLSRRPDGAAPRRRRQYAPSWPPGMRQTGLPIGEVLKRTRTRHKIDIRTVEQQTKIRIKYLRALENEEWDVLPGPAVRQGLPADLRPIPRPRRRRPGRRVPAHGRGGAGRRPRLSVQRARAGAPPATGRGAAAPLAGEGVGRAASSARPSWSCCWSSG